MAPRLVVVSDYAWPTGGVEEFVAALLAHAARSYDCRLVTWSSEVKAPPQFQGLRIAYNGDARVLWSELDAADVAIVVTSFNVRLLARAAAEYLSSNRLAAVTVVQTSDHSDPSSSAVQYQERWLLTLTNASQRVVAVSTDVASNLRRVGVKHETLVVIENGARLSVCTSRTRGRECVAFIGRPHPQKGYHLFERLARERRASRLRFRANTVSVPPTAKIAGVEYSYALSDDDLVEFFDAADLIIAPYLRADGWPLALVEGLNCGVPILGFDVPGVGPLLKRHGQIVVKPTYEALRAAIDDWAEGRLAAVGPTPGSIADWRRQIEFYLDVLNCARATTARVALSHDGHCTRRGRRYSR